MHSISNALFIGKVLHELDQIDSTNNYALDLLSKSRPIEGTAIIAYDQHDGRGQIGNEWHSEAGKNLTTSIILYPDFIKPTEQFILNQAISLGVKDFVQAQLEREIKIKWPNDIYHQDQKIGGLLIENTITGNKISNTVIGIGININQTEFMFGLPNPTSLKKITDADYDVKQISKRLFDYVEQRYLQLKRGAFDEIRSVYLEAMYKLDIECYFADKDNQLFKGKIVGVKESGQLLVESYGNVKAFEFKEIVYV